MGKFRDYFWFSVAFALFCGAILGGSVEFYFAFPTSDWAANGVPFLTRLVQTSGWALEGFVPGAIFGFILGPMVYKLFPSDEWVDADATGERAKLVEKWSQISFWVIRIGLFVFFLLVVADVL